MTEADHKAAGRLPTLREYLIHRRYSSAMDMVLDFCEPCLGAELAEPVHACPSYVTLRTSACYSTALINDVVGYPRDVRNGYFHNAIHLASVQYGGSLHDTVQHIHELINEYVERFLSAKSQLVEELARLPLSPRQKSRTQRCVTAYESWIAGFLR